MFTPEDRQAIVDIVAPLLEQTLAAVIPQAVAAAGQSVWRPGTCQSIDAAGVATVLVDGDTAPIDAGIIGVWPLAGARVIVVFVAPGAVFCFGIVATPPEFPA